MNEVFGSQLRQELIDFIGRSEFMRACASSTGSQRLSLDSVGDLDAKHAGLDWAAQAKKAF